MLHRYVNYLMVYSLGSNKLRKAKARFSYHPEAEDELELADGDEVIILDVIEDGWWKGRVGTKEGVFPSNFVEEIPEVNEPTPPPAVAPTEPPPPSTGMCVCLCSVCIFVVLMVDLITYHMSGAVATDPCGGNQ